MIERAADAAIAESAISPRRDRFKVRALVAVAAVLLCVGSFVGTAAWLTRERLDGSNETPTFAALPTGDQIITTAGADLDVTSATQEDRSLVVHAGTALFDVSPLSEGERFEVQTQHLSAHVRGTVFSVEVERDRSVVRVYEGSVLIEQEGRQRLLAAAVKYASDSAGLEPLTAGPLWVQGFEAARRRNARASAADGPAQEVEPAVEPPGVTVDATARGAEPPVPNRGDSGTAQIVNAPPRSITMVEARAWLVERRAVDALDAARRALEAEPASGGWRMLEADALRILARYPEAASSYDQAARYLAPAPAAQAGYLAASVRLRRLGDPAGALGSLDASGADAAGSPLRERSLALRTRILLRSGRDAEASRVARTYLRHYPEGGMAEQMRVLAASPDKKP